MNPVKVCAGPKQRCQTQGNQFFRKRLLDFSDGLMSSVSHWIFLVLQEQERPVLLLIPIHSSVDMNWMWRKRKNSDSRCQPQRQASESLFLWPKIGDITGIVPRTPRTYLKYPWKVWILCFSSKLLYKHVRYTDGMNSFDYSIYFIVTIVDIKLKKRTSLLRHINMMKSFLFRFIAVVSHQRLVCV